MIPNGGKAMKRYLALVMALVLTVALFSGCKGGEGSGESGAGSVRLKVVTSYGGDDGNRPNYEKAYQDWEKKTGNKVEDSSAKADDQWKVQVMADFKVGSEPDVLFFFSGADANSIVSSKKVMSIEEIRKVDPDYASNMDENKMIASPLDGKLYSVPVNGFWESMFVNKTVLDACGVAVPGPDYTMDQFMADCEKIKNTAAPGGGNYAPIAASLHNMPNYWFEYLAYNYLTPSTHNILPESVDDKNGQAWVNGLGDLKMLYEKGYFPSNTMSASDDETFKLFTDDKAAFLMDGSWKIGALEEAYATTPDKLVNIIMAYPPAYADGSRKSTDLISGISMGYYITRKAFEDPAKRDAAIDFVKYMTSDEVVATFCTAGNATALKNGLPKMEGASVLIDSVNKMHENATGYTTGAVQDQLDNEGVRTPFFNNVKKMVTGQMDIRKSVEDVLKAQKDFADAKAEANQ
jgi:raffinose/stachyose/melibiose transport system substrate-binding protein